LIRLAEFCWHLQRNTFLLKQDNNKRTASSQNETNISQIKTWHQRRVEVTVMYPDLHSFMDRFNTDYWHNVRQSFVENGSPGTVTPGDAVPDWILQSWKRCQIEGLQMNSPSAFDPVSAVSLKRLLQREAAMLQAAQPALERLQKEVSGCGYRVLMTDRFGRALWTDTNGSESQLLTRAFRPGVDLSEMGIGTSAMALALQHQRPVRVIGPQHFFDHAIDIVCFATPVFGAHGGLLGVVNVSRQSPGALAVETLVETLVHHCGQEIEQYLFWQQVGYEPDVLTVQFEPGYERAAIAFRSDGEAVALTRSALSGLGISGMSTNTSQHFTLPDFGALFEEPLSPLFHRASISPMGIQGSSHALHLHGGVRLTARLSRSGSTRESSSRQYEHINSKFVKQNPTVFKAYEADIPVLIRGETGTGKEVLARSLHQHGSRREGPFIAVNCGTISPELMAAELFGYAEGAFTGAKKGGQIGKFEAAENGTLLLDELGDMPLTVQVALLRVLDRREVVRVGGHHACSVNTRIICATHQDLQQAVVQGRFRQDLYFRIAAMEKLIPPLRQRDDFDALLDSLLTSNGIAVNRISQPLRHQLAAQPWPGNVRQLNNEIKLAAVLADLDRMLDAGDFPALSNGSSVSEAGTTDLYQPQNSGELAGAVISWDKSTRNAAFKALEKTAGNVTAAAALLGIGRATLYRKIAEWREREAGEIPP
jgi:sigma-54 dependent transcriptional regulator, acetoin dehydrogenase operon transcriptional activator AcoR